MSNRAKRKRCRHCRRKPVGRPRGLCWGCSKSAAVRALYPTAGPCQGAREVADFCGTAGPPPAPTAALPATADKIAAMARRARAGVALFHALDARADLT